MRRRAPVARSFGSETLAKMNAYLVVSVLLVAGSAVGYNVRREAPYNGYSEPYYSGIGNNNYNEPSQRLFWGEQGGNQVGGTGLWATLTNKFPFLGNMFGRLELSNQYGVPGQQSSISNSYGVPAQQSGLSNSYGLPAQQSISTNYGVPGYQGQYQVPQGGQFYQQPNQQFGQRFVPFGRDVGLTDDAVIITPPFVPVAPQPAPAPVPVPQPIPAAPVDQGYRYDKPLLRLELPRK